MLKPEEIQPIEELEAIRIKLLQQIEEAPRLFPTECNGHELLTSKAALNNIERLIKQQRRKEIVRGHAFLRSAAN